MGYEFGLGAVSYSKGGRATTGIRIEGCNCKIWSTNQQKIEIVLSGHKGSVSCDRWGGRGFIYTGSHDKTVKVWNANDGTLAHSLNTHAHWVNLALSTDFVLRTAYHDHTEKVPDSAEERVAKAKE